MFDMCRRMKDDCFEAEEQDLPFMYGADTGQFSPLVSLQSTLQNT